MALTVGLKNFTVVQHFINIIFIFNSSDLRYNYSQYVPVRVLCSFAGLSVNAVQSQVKISSHNGNLDQLSEVRVESDKRTRKEWYALNLRTHETVLKLIIKISTSFYNIVTVNCFIFEFTLMIILLKNQDLQDWCLELVRFCNTLYKPQLQYTVVHTEKRNHQNLKLLDARSLLYATSAIIRD